MTSSDSLEAKAAASMQYDDDEQSGDENTLWGGDEVQACLFSLLLSPSFYI